MRSLARRHERLTAERRSRKLKDLALSLCFIGPSVLGVLIFFVLPFCVVVYYSVIRNSINPEFVFLDNFIALFQNSAFRDAAKNTATFSALAVPLAVILSLGLAMLLEARIPLKSQFRTFFLSPMMVPVASVVLIWQVLFSNNGVINEFTALFGIAKIDWIKSEYGQIVILTLFLWKNLGYNMILFMSSLANIPRELLEVADVEGASETLTATVAPAEATNQKVTWKSSNAAVATDKVGTVTITATSKADPAKKGTCTIKVSGDQTDIGYGEYGPEENW